MPAKQEAHGSLGTVVRGEARHVFSHVESNRTTAEVTTATSSTESTSGGVVVVASGIASILGVGRKVGMPQVRVLLNVTGVRDH